MNLGAADLTGYAREELLGMNAFDLLVPEERERARAHLAAGMEPGLTTTSDWRIRTKAGAERVLEIKHRLLMENGRPARVECIARDVTERQEAHSGGGHAAAAAGRTVASRRREWRASAGSPAAWRTTSTIC